MDKTIIDKLFDLDTSAEERDILCELAFGKSFADSIREIRYKDFLSGVSSGEYTLMSIRTVQNTEKIKSISIDFACEYYSSGRVRDFLYEHQDDESYLGPRHARAGLGLAWHLYPGPKFYSIYLDPKEIDLRLLDAIKEAATKDGCGEIARSLLGFLNKYNIGDEKKKED